MGISNIHNNAEKVISKVSTKYTDAAKTKNKELDLISEELENYRKNITDIFSVISIEFPNDKSFYLGVETIVNEIYTAIDNCEENIVNMKKSSLDVAKKKDEDLTAQLMYEEGEKAK